MAYWSEEEKEFHHENSTKKHVAASAHKQRTHCGKGGCKLPSDFMTKKEIKAMNGEAKTFNLNKPMYWDTFKVMPDDLKREYINGLREKFDVPDNKIAEMFGIGIGTISRWFRCLGLSVTENRGKRKWDEDGWDYWRGAKYDLPEIPVTEDAVVAAPEAPVEAVEAEIDIPVENKTMRNPDSPYAHQTVKRAIPANGSMTFDGPIEDIVETLRMLLAGAEVTLDVAWTVVEPDPGVCCKPMEE